MLNFGNLLSDVFDHRAEARMTAEEERAAILRAQAGDEQAQLDLVLAYAPALRNAVADYARHLPSSPKREDLEDVRSNAVVGLLEAVQAFDPDVHARLAATATSYIRNAVSVSAAVATSFSVPERTLKRFFGILREADGDVVRAAMIAPTREMRPETFLAVLDAVRAVESYDALSSTTGPIGAGGGGWSLGAGSEEPHATPIGSAADAIADVEDRVLVDAAFAAVDRQEREVVGLAYGFSDYEPVSDGEIAERVGYSRAKVQRTRAGALGKMRSALGVA